MSNITIHERPGVYSSFDASSVLSAAKAAGVVGVAAMASSGTANKVETITSAAEGIAIFGEDATDTIGMASLLETLYANGAGTVKAVRVSADTKESYEAAFKALEDEENIRVVVCGSVDKDVQLELKESVENASLAQRERIAVAAFDGQTVSEMTARAALLNSERVVLIAGKLKEGGSCLPAAAAVAAAIALSSDPSVPISGAVLTDIDSVTGRFSDTQIDALVTGGVTAVEALAGEVSVVRAVTTRTKTNGVTDTTWRELTTILIADDVIPALRNALRTRFGRSKNTAQTRGAIRSQIIMELENKLSHQIIDSYGDVSVGVAVNDPTVCEAVFGFAVAHGLSRIYLTAHISV